MKLLLMHGIRNLVILIVICALATALALILVEHLGVP